jgi:hypothetical protein
MGECLGSVYRSRQRVADFFVSIEKSSGKVSSCFVWCGTYSLIFGIWKGHRPQKESLRAQAYINV